MNTRSLVSMLIMSRAITPLLVCLRGFHTDKNNPNLKIIVIRLSVRLSTRFESITAGLILLKLRIYFMPLEATKDSSFLFYCPTIDNNVVDARTYEVETTRASLHKCNYHRNE
jgi:hypothetical protein